MSKVKGVPAYVLRTANFPDCTHNGLSSRYDRVLIVGKGIPPVIELRDDMFPVKIVRKEVGGKEYLSLRPIECEGFEYPKKDRWHQMGGNFAYAFDCRMHELNPYPLPIHDRVED